MLLFGVTGTLPGSRKEAASLFHAFFSPLRGDKLETLGYTAKTFVLDLFCACFISVYSVSVLLN